jgi:hypothetical protein
MAHESDPEPVEVRLRRLAAALPLLGGTALTLTENGYGWLADVTQVLAVLAAVMAGITLRTLPRSAMNPQPVGTPAKLSISGSAPTQRSSPPSAGGTVPNPARSTPHLPDQDTSAAHPGPAQQVSRPSALTTPLQAPPRFGCGSPAHARQWRLPAKPSPSSAVVDAARLHDLTVRAASIVGPGHRCDDPADPRQDAYRIARDEQGHWFIAAVADGVSSSSHAEVGAQVAVDATVDLLYQELRDPPQINAGRLFNQVSGTVAHAASKRGLKPADVCTALTTLITRARGNDPSGQRRATLFWVGDVSAWLLRQGRWALVAGDARLLARSGGFG